MRLIGAALAAALGMAAPAHAAFEGCLHTRISMGPQKGTQVNCMAKGGWRSETEMQLPQSDPPHKMVTLGKTSNPNVLYILHDNTKTYSEFDHSQARASEEPKDPKGTLKKLGKEKIAGVLCDHYQLTQQDGRQVEIWSTQELFGPEGLEALRAQNVSRSGGGLMKQLLDAGVQGYPLKMVMHASEQKGAAMTYEVVKIEKKPVPASLFEIPAGYTKSNSPAASGDNQLTPEHQKQIEQYHRQMTPEQRKMYEDAMKKYQQGSPAGAAGQPEGATGR
jgi:hypothetical protein